jgi:hypothetical protein
MRNKVEDFVPDVSSGGTFHKEVSFPIYDSVVSRNRQI